MSYRVPLYFLALSDKGRAHALIRQSRIDTASPRMQRLIEPTFKLENLDPDVIAWLAERRIKPTRIFAHEIEFLTAEAAFEFKMAWG